MSAKRQQRTSICVTFRTIQQCPQDDTLRHPQDVIFQSPDNVVRERWAGTSLGVAQRIIWGCSQQFFVNILRTFQGRNFSEWVITGLNNITLRKVNIKPYRSDKIYMAKDLIEGKLDKLIYQFIERKINNRDFCFVLLDNIDHFYEGNGRTYKILFLGNVSQVLYFLNCKFT